MLGSFPSPPFSFLFYLFGFFTTMFACCPLQVLLDEDDKERAADLAELLYETSLLTSGFALDQPKDYASKVYTLMKIALGVDLDEEPEQPAAAPAAAAAASSSESSSAAAAATSSSPSTEPKVESVEADVVVEGKGGDPWGKN
jgi:hypothetical protein